MKFVAAVQPIDGLLSTTRMINPDSEPGTNYQREADQGTPPETTELQVELPLPWSLATGCDSLFHCLLHKSLGPGYTSLVLIVAVLGLYFAATDHMGVVVALGVFGALCGLLLSGVSAFGQNRMEGNMTSIRTDITNIRTDITNMEANMRSIAATLRSIQEAITQRDDENQV